LIKTLCRSLMVVLLLCSGSAELAAPEQPAVTLAVGGKNLFYSLPLTVAERLGYFKDEGLTLDIVDFPGGAKALQAVVGGSAQFAAGAFEHVLHMQAKGQPIRAIVLMARYPAMVLGLSPSAAARFNTFADLRGMKIGVTAPGSSTHLVLNQLLSQHGVAADEVAVIGVGAAASAAHAKVLLKSSLLVKTMPARLAGRAAYFTWAHTT
jgi:NitT/TauT family transport system substrate-binding protein